MYYLWYDDCGEMRVLEEDNDRIAHNLINHLAIHGLLWSVEYMQLGYPTRMSVLYVRIVE